LKRLRIT